MTKSKYLRPSIETLAGRHIIERMGPVSCGSSFDSPQPDGTSDETLNAGSLQNLCK